MPDLLFFLLLGHFLGDFALQTDVMARDKGCSQSVLSKHVAMYTLTIGVALAVGLYLSGSDAFLTPTTAAVLIVVFVEHWIQDFSKPALFNAGKQGFFIDQALHVLVLFIVRVVVYGN